MPSRECSRALALVAATWLSSAAPALAESYQVVSATVTAVCRLTIGGSFEARSTALAGTVSLDPRGEGHLRGDLTLDLGTLETGIRLRDTHLRERYLEVQLPENRLAVLTGIRVENTAVQGLVPGSYPFRAQLRLRGREEQVAGRVEIRVDGSRWRAEAVFPMRLSAFEIARPAYLGVGVSDELSVRVKLTVLHAGHPFPSADSDP